MSVADKMADHFVPEVDPNPAEPRMVIWSTLRCLELQIDQHEELYNSDGVVSWELLKHMVRLSKRHAHEEGGKASAAERETDEWRTRADEANAKLRETEQELDRLRKVHMEFQSEELTEARATIADLQQQLDAARAETVETRKRLNNETDRHRATNAEKIELFQQKESANKHNAELREQLDAANAAVALQRAWIERLQAFVAEVRQARDEYQWPDSWDAILGALADLDDEPTEPTPVAEPQHQEFWRWQKQFDDAHQIILSQMQQELDDARETILAQKRGIQYLRLLIDKVRGIVCRDDAMSERLEQISQALDEFDHGTIEPTPCPECERLRAFVQKARQTIGRTMNFCDVEFLLNALAELDEEPAPATEPAPVRDLNREREVPEVANLNTLGQLFQHAVSDAFSEINSLRQQLDAALAAVSLQRAGIERLHKFVGKVRLAMWPEDIKSALTELDAGAEPAPVAEPAEKQWFRSHVQIDGCDGSTVNEKPYWESAWVWVSGQPADWRQLARRGDSQIPEWVWESLGLQMLCHAETRFNSQTNMMEFRNWEQRSPPTPVAEPVDGEGER